MANKTRSPETIDFEKKRMSKAALEIIVKDGYNGLSMRKLSKKLNISPTTIYNYFKNQDEIYIYVLNYGFELLLSELEKAYNSYHDPVEKLKAACKSTLSFAKRERELSFIMFILDTPKYYDFADSNYEPLMRIELYNALKCRDVYFRIISEIATESPSFKNEAVPFRTLSTIHQLIGLVTIYNNNIIKYISDNVDEDVERLLEEIYRPFEVL